MSNHIFVINLKRCLNKKENEIKIKWIRFQYDRSGRWKRFKS